MERALERCIMKQQKREIETSMGPRNLGRHKLRQMTVNAGLIEGSSIEECHFILGFKSSFGSLSGSRGRS